MRANEAFPSKYLKSADVKDRPLVATISHIAKETVGTGPDPQEKFVIHFENCKPMVLNRTNWDSLEDAFGDSDDWTAHKVRIKCARTSFQGKSVDGVRLEPITPKPAASDDPNDSLPESLKAKAV